MTVKPKLTLDEFLALPETEPASEYVCGEVIQKPMPTLTHSLLQGFFVAVLLQFLRTSGLGWRVGPELRCVFGPPGRERPYVPDVVVLSPERLPQGDTRRVVPFRAPPDVAIEILSPDQPSGRSKAKTHVYLRAGAPPMCVADPPA